MKQAETNKTTNGTQQDTLQDAIRKMNGTRQEGFSRDKWYHFVAGFLIGLGAALLLWHFKGEMMLALAAPLAAGILKELWDKLVRKTVFDPLDLVFTIVGGVIGLWIFIFIIPV